MAGIAGVDEFWVFLLFFGQSNRFDGCQFATGAADRIAVLPEAEIQDKYDLASSCKLQATSQDLNKRYLQLAACRL